MLPRRALWITGFAFAMLFVSVAGKAWAVAQFSADLVMTREGKESVGRFFFKESHYRMEVEENQATIAVIVDQQKKITRVVNPKEKKYMEMPSDSLISLMNDPFQSILVAGSKYKEVNKGSEDIQGYPCEKMVYLALEEIVYTAWWSRKFNMPLKIIFNKMRKNSAELKNIKETDLDSSLFKIPTGYTKMEKPKKEPAKAAARPKSAISSTLAVDAPIGRRITKGGALQITVDPEKQITLVLTNESIEESVVTISATLQGKPFTARSLPKNAITLQQSKSKEISFAEKRNPDTIVVKIDKGLVYARLDQELPMWAKEKSQQNFLGPGGGIGFLTKPGRKIECTVIADSQDQPESKFTITFFKGTYKDAVVKEDIVLKNGATKTWEFTADKGIASGQVDMKEGYIKFSLYQPAETKGKKADMRAASIKEVQEFSVNFPSGAGKRVDPDKHLVVSVTGSSAAKGTINLYRGVQGKEKISTEKFALQKEESKSWKYAKEKQITKVSVFVMKGSFTVRLDQSPNAALPETVAAPASRPVAKPAGITVASPPSPPVSNSKLSAGLQVEAPAIVAAGSTFQVSWQGPNKPNDYITIVLATAKDSEYLNYTYTASGSPANLLAPTKPGDYEVRYVLDKTRKPLARTPVKVTSVAARVEAPATVNAGANFKVSWEGPNYSGDYITIVPKGANDSQYLSYAYTTNGAPAALQAPEKPGEYEVRYIVDQSKTVIGRTAVSVK